jgi:hypothetical protein
MSEHADIVVVKFPIGVMALVWLDLATGAIATSNVGLRQALRGGCKDWAGNDVYPQDGGIFLSAIYDHFFLRGYGVEWLSLSGFTETGRTYRV